MEIIKNVESTSLGLDNRVIGEKRIIYSLREEIVVGIE